MTNPNEFSMRGWGESVETIKKDNQKLDQLAKDLSGPRAEGWKRLDDLNLPRYVVRTFPLSVFLEKKDEIIPQNVNHKWFVILDQHRGGMGRYRKPGLTSDEAKSFVHDTLQQNNLNPEDFEISVTENYPQKFGGNIIISEEGQLLAEFHQGGQGVIAEGRFDQHEHGILYSVERNPMLGSFKYSWEDGDGNNELPLRELIHNTIMSIPHDGEGREMKFTPGYYEFALIQKNPFKNPEPIFLDARRNSSLTSYK